MGTWGAPLGGDPRLCCATRTGLNRRMHGEPQCGFARMSGVAVTMAYPTPHLRLDAALLVRLFDDNCRDGKVEMRCGAEWIGIEHLDAKPERVILYQEFPELYLR